MTRKNSAILAALAIAALAAPSVSRTQGVPADGVLRDFQPSGEYALIVDGVPVPKAEVYQNDNIPAILVLTSALPSPVLLTPRTGNVETVHIMKVAKQADGTVDLLADAVLAQVGRFEMSGENVKFAYQGKRVSLNPKPPLTGLRQGAELKAHNPEYARSASVYQPNGAAIAALKTEPKAVKVRVFFGSWCPHCRTHIPFLLRVEDELKGSQVTFEYIGLPRPPQAWQDPEVKRLKIGGVPTGIVYVGGKEVGRITGEGWNAPEVLLNKIVKSPAAKGR
jgi:thiol-disulfide isomerase/thioredoxin